MSKLVISMESEVAGNDAKGGRVARAPLETLEIFEEGGLPVYRNNRMSGPLVWETTAAW